MRGGPVKISPPQRAGQRLQTKIIAYLVDGYFFKTTVARLKSRAWRKRSCAFFVFLETFYLLWASMKKLVRWFISSPLPKASRSKSGSFAKIPIRVYKFRSQEVHHHDINPISGLFPAQRRGRGTQTLSSVFTIERRRKNERQIFDLLRLARIRFCGFSLWGCRARARRNGRPGCASRTGSASSPSSSRIFFKQRAILPAERQSGSRYVF